MKANTHMVDKHSELRWTCRGVSRLSTRQLWCYQQKGILGAPQRCHVEATTRSAPHPAGGFPRAACRLLGAHGELLVPDSYDTAGLVAHSWWCENGASLQSGSGFIPSWHRWGSRHAAWATWPAGACASHGGAHAMPPPAARKLAVGALPRNCVGLVGNVLHFFLHTIKQNHFKNVKTSIWAIILVMTIWLLCQTIGKMATRLQISY